MINSVREFLDSVFSQHEIWTQLRRPDEPLFQPWFRGEPLNDRPLVPRLYRGKPPHYEYDMLENFRRMAALPHFSAGLDRKANDTWLYLARHAGLPTRLLDWTEGALIALFFAVSENRPSAVWMLQPVALNVLSDVQGFESPWDERTATAAAIRAAWQNDTDRRHVERDPDLKDLLPLALYPQHIHPRLQVQQSCFTIHGRVNESLNTLMTAAGDGSYLVSFEIEFTRHQRILSELRLSGISHGTLFPDLDGLATDLTQHFWRPSDK